MKTLLRVTALLVAVSAAEFIVFMVLQRNLSAGVYPVEADSIGLPLFTSAVVLAVFTVFLAVGFLRARASGWLSALGFTALVLAALVAGLYGLAWADEWHWPVAVSFAALAVTMPLLVGGRGNHRRNQRRGCEP
jgi:hypothetical protein